MENELIGFKLYLMQGKGSAKGKLITRSPQTVELHIATLRRLMLHCPSLSVVEIQQHLLDLKEKGRTGNYLNDYISVLHIYGRYKGTEEYKELEEFMEEEFIAAPMSKEEIESFLNLPPPTSKVWNHKSKKYITYTYPKRWDLKTMFWKIFAHHPIRPGGVAALTVHDVDWGLNAFRIDDKTRKDSLMPIHPAIKEDLKKYIDTLETEYLFPNQGKGETQKKFINDVDWGYDFHGRIKRLGIKRKNLRPYSVRHSDLTRLLRAGNNIFMVMNLAGQKRPETLMKYWHNDLEAKREAISKDPLGIKHLPTYEKQKMLREKVIDYVESLASSIEEEKELIAGLKVFE